MIRKMRFLSDQEGIMNRYLRESANWQSHLQNTQNFIMESFRDSNPETVAILGSGWLLDLPLENLVHRFKTLLLVDIHHPVQVKNRIKDYKNVALQEIDITGGGIEFAWRLQKNNDHNSIRSQLDSLELQAPKLMLEPDAFISLNILNQLDIMLVDFIKDNLNFDDSDEISLLRQKIQQFHIEWISQKKGCLISDVEEENIYDDGTVTKQSLQHTRLPDSFRSQNWVWDFDLSGYYHRGIQTKMRVEAREW